MNGWRGVLGGALALVALQTLVQPTAAARAGGLIGWSTGLVRKFMDPTVPAIPDNSKPHQSFDPFAAFASAIGSAVGGVATAPLDVAKDAGQKGLDVARTVIGVIPGLGFVVK